MKSLHHNKSFGLFVIRLVVGVLFVLHGYMKLSNIDGTVAGFTQMGFAPFWAYVVSLVEFLGGISLVIGYGASVASALLAITMLVAILTVHKTGGLIGPNSGELAIVMFAVTLGLTFAGSGKYSLSSCCGCATKQGTCPVDVPCGCNKDDSKKV